MNKKAKHGRQLSQKMKPYLVYRFLMKKSDENHTVTNTEICDHLDTMGISAERKSIVRDIEEVNKALLLDDGDFYGVYDMEDAEDVVQDEDNKTIIYNPKTKGYYVRNRHYDERDMRMLAECVYSAKFIDDKRAKRLISVVCEHVSDYEAENIKHEVFLTDRVKTESTAIYDTINTINNAMSRNLDGKPHLPEKISFKYLKHSIHNLRQRVERRSGAPYVVSPFKLMINDGFYYLIAFDDKSKQIRTFRIDRMAEVKRTGELREGAEEFKKINLESYAQEHFGMFGGKKEHITLRFIMPLLDTVVDRFGTRGVIYTKDDEKHFKVTTTVVVSDQFFGWLCGFGNKVKIISPSPIVEDFKKYLTKINALYSYEQGDNH